MIVRISNEGQYEVGEDDVAKLNELDNAAVAACESSSEEAFHNGLRRAARLRAQHRPDGRRRRPHGLRHHPAAA